MSDMLLCAAVSALAFVSPRAFVGPSLVSLPRPLLVAHDGHLRAHRAAAPFTRHQGCRLSAGTGPVPESDEDTTCPTDGPGMMELARFTLPTLSALLSSEVMSVIDTAVVGASSSKELAALGPAIMLTDSSAYLFFWLNVACTNLVASAMAKDDAEEAFKSVSDALWCGATHPNPNPNPHPNSNPNPSPNPSLTLALTLTLTLTLILGAARSSAWP